MTRLQNAHYQTLRGSAYIVPAGRDEAGVRRANRPRDPRVAVASVAGGFSMTEKVTITHPGWVWDVYPNPFSEFANAPAWLWHVAPRGVPAPPDAVRSGRERLGE